MGQGNSNLPPRSTQSCPGPNNLPPLQFHQVHGDNIRICRDGTMAKRYESFCKGISFSARPVKLNERVCVKFSEISNNWSGVIRFGFTSNDPATLRTSLPKYACPDLTNKPGYWAKALNERFCERDNILFYYVTPTGDVHFGVNGEEKGVFITGVETRGPLWTLIDIYGNCSAIEFLDSRLYMFQQQQQQQQQQQHHHHHHHSSRRSINAAEPEVDRLQSSFQSINIGNEELPAQILHRSCAAVAPGVSAGNGRIPIPFHRTKGRNITLSADRFIATRADTEFCQGYVFTARPIRIGERVIVQILRTEHMYVGALALGLTSCDPASLQPTDLPDDSDMLLDRPEYWVVSKDVASTPVRNDEISFCVTANGEVQISKNGGPASVVMHVDQSLQLWAFLDVYGSTQSVRILSQPLTSPVAAMPTSPRRLQVHLPSSESVNSLNSQVSQQSENQRKLQQQQQAAAAAQIAASRVINVPATSDMIQLQPGGTVLVVNLPPTHPTEVMQQQQQQQQQQQHQQQQLQQQQITAANAATAAAARIQQVPIAAVPSSSATLLSNYSNTYVEPVSIQQNYNQITTWQDTSAQSNLANGAECTICYEHPIDSVLYMCGHMCMCYECAIQQWRGIGGGHCPLCRAVIRDVIRIYKS